MGKALKSWSGMRKYLEQEMLADTLRGRVWFSCTKFVGMDGSAVFQITIDDHYIKRFSMDTVAKDAYETYYSDKPTDMHQFWQAYWDEFEYAPIEERREFDDTEFSKAFFQYRSFPISEALNSENPVVRMFAILDRRVGKKTLKSIKDKVDSQPEWLQYFYLLRLNAENILLPVK